MSPLRSSLSRYFFRKKYGFLLTIHARAAISVRECPVLTANVASEAGQVRVDGDKCIACGACFDACPHNARDFYDDTEKFLTIWRVERRFWDT